MSVDIPVFSPTAKHLCAASKNSEFKAQPLLSLSIFFDGRVKHGGKVGSGAVMCGLEALTGKSQQEGVAPGWGIKFNRAGKGQLCSLKQLRGFKNGTDSYSDLFTNKHFQAVNAP